MVKKDGIHLAEEPCRPSGGPAALDLHPFEEDSRRAQHQFGRSRPTFLQPSITPAAAAAAPLIGPLGLQTFLPSSDVHAGAAAVSEPPASPDWFWTPEAGPLRSN